MKQPKTHRVQVGTSTIEYELIYSKRKTLGIHVYPDTRVIVRAPLNSDFKFIETHVLSRAAWILKHQRQFREKPTLSAPPITRQYINGETFRYLGSTYTLKINEERLERVQLDGTLLVASVRDVHNTKRIAALVDRWFRLQAERVFTERLAACFPRVESWGVKFPPMRIRDMKSRWGSCSSKGNVSLNLRLIHMPVDLIDYVVLHELCHLKELNHSPKFWKLMDRVLPDWRERRKRLNQTEI